MYQPVTTKKRMYELFERGVFGNRPQCWYSLDALMADSYTGLVSMRSREVSNPVRLYHVPKLDIPNTVAALPSRTRQIGLVFSEAPPDHLRTIQGEWDGARLTYSFAPLPMRLAFDKQKLSAEWSKARLILKSYMSIEDYEWMDDLLDKFPGHTIEFSATSVPVGVLQTHCIFWEVRLY